MALIGETGMRRDGRNRRVSFRHEPHGSLHPRLQSKNAWRHAKGAAEASRQRPRRQTIGLSDVFKRGMVFAIECACDHMQRIVGVLIERLHTRRRQKRVTPFGIALQIV